MADRTDDDVKPVDLAERLLKTAGLLGIIGYMALRARFNHLGISSTSSLGLERYLMEFYPLFVATFLPLTLLLMCLVIVLIPFYAIGIQLAKRESIRRWFDRIQSRATGVCHSPAGPLSLLLLLLLYYIWIVASLGFNKDFTDIAIGQLSLEKLSGPTGLTPYYLTLVVCFLGYWVRAHLSPVQKEHGPYSTRLSHFAWRFFALAVIALVFHLPLLYGVGISTEYPVTQIVTDDSSAAPIKGLLVLETANSVVLWRAENGVGSGVEIPRTHIRSITTGRLVDLVKVAQTAARTPHGSLPEWP
jgi:hypothetical protein